MRTFRGIAALTLAFALVLSITGCGDKDTLVRVNGEEITRPAFDRLFAQVESQMGGSLDETMTAQYKTMLLDMMIESMLVRQEAERLGADISEEAVDAEMSTMMGGTTDTAAFEEQIEAAGLTMDDLRSSIRDSIAQRFLQDYVSKEASGAALTEAWSSLSHILVADEEKANELYEQLQDGADFGELAKDNSTDPGSAANNGSLGWSTTSAYVTEFKDAADTLKVGEVSKPVKSDFGWHIIRKDAEAAEGTAISELDAEAAAAYQATSGSTLLQDYVADLRAKAEIEYIDETLKPATTE